MSILKFKPKKNTNVVDLLNKAEGQVVSGLNTTKCIIIMESNDEIGKSNITYETCGLHLSEAIGMLEITKVKLMEEN